MFLPQLACHFQADWIHGSTCQWQDWPLGLLLFLFMSLWSEGNFLQLDLFALAHVDLLNFPRVVVFFLRASPTMDFPFPLLTIIADSLFKVLIQRFGNVKASSFRSGQDVWLASRHLCFGCDGRAVLKWVMLRRTRRVLFGSMPSALQWGREGSTRLGQISTVCLGKTQGRPLGFLTWMPPRTKASPGEKRHRWRIWRIPRSTSPGQNWSSLALGRQGREGQTR